MIVYQFYPILVLVVGILQIILFFKLWGMTNNVKKIKEMANNSGWDTAKIETLAGNYDKAFEIYHKCFITEVYVLYNKAAYNTYYLEAYKPLVEIYSKRLETLKGDYSIDFEEYDSLEKVKKQILS